MESHLTECPVCREKLNRFRQLTCRLDADAEQQMIETAKNRVWQNLQSRRRFQPHSGGLRRSGVWQRKLSIPLPAAAAAAIIIMLMTALWFRGEQVDNFGIAGSQTDISERTNFFIAADEEMPNIMPVTDINSVLQFLASEGTDIIILTLPEDRSFSRTGEPAIIRAADYSPYRRQP
jgi:hypothetical protein